MNTKLLFVICSTLALGHLNAEAQLYHCYTHKSATGSYEDSFADASLILRTHSQTNLIDIKGQITITESSDGYESHDKNIILLPILASDLSPDRELHSITQRPHTRYPGIQANSNNRADLILMLPSKKDNSQFELKVMYTYEGNGGTATLTCSRFSSLFD